MSLIIEDGSIVADANSYITLAEAKAFALLRGDTLPADDAVITSSIIKASDYLESFALDFVGSQVSPSTQSLSWPRKCVMYQDGTLYPDNEIPQALKNAQCQLCIEQANGIELMPTVEAGGYIVRERIDVLETEYSERIVNRQPYMPKVNNFLASLLQSTNAGPLRSVRV